MAHLTSGGRCAPPSPVSALPRRGEPARLTRRGQLALVLLVAFVALLAFSVGRASVEAATQARPAVSYVTVEPGDTLWSIAKRVAPERDPRATLGRLQEINGLRAGTIRAGQRLAVPASG